MLDRSLTESAILEQLGEHAKVAFECELPGNHPYVTSIWLSSNAKIHLNLPEDLPVQLQGICNEGDEVEENICSAISTDADEDTPVFNTMTGLRDVILDLFWNAVEHGGYCKQGAVTIKILQNANTYGGIITQVGNGFCVEDVDSGRILPQTSREFGGGGGEGKLQALKDELRVNFIQEENRFVTLVLLELPSEED